MMNDRRASQGFMSNRKAIITMAVGDAYLRLWREKCRNGWQKYADKHGYDVVCIDTPLDDSVRARQRSPAWQKCLILGQKFIEKYERVVWVDADILINHASAPCIASTVPINKIGAVDAWAMPSPELAQAALDRLYDYWGDTCTIRDRTAQDYYASYGIAADFEQVVQTGVLVLSPSHHRYLLEKVYFDYEETGKGNFEMRPLSYELLKADSVHWLNHRFNLVWLVYKVLYYPFLLGAPPRNSGLLAKINRRFFRFTTICRDRS
ncbi:MAG: hypothetical protein WKF71_15025 [Pyrinomonadaceae bacterium]